MNAQPRRLIYLHGFRSSPQSFKAQWLGQRMAQLGLADRWLCPSLPMSPAKAIRLIRETIDPQPEDCLVGSSLGGYYATFMAEYTGCQAVLLNPVVHAERDLATQVGEHLPYHEPQARPERFHFEYLDELRALSIGSISFPERYFLIAATGDEVLDWREMAAHYRGAKQWVLNGSDHGLSDFAQYGDEVLAFSRWL
jgi:uncharacterized protein